MLRDLQPDVVCLQEAPRLLLWRTSRHLLARRAGLRLATRERACGLAVLCAPRVERLQAYAVVLPPRPGLHRRGVAVATLRVDGTVLAVASTHLDLEPGARHDSARRVRAAVPDGPLVLAADVNEQPGGPAWDALGAGLVDARTGLGPTFPSRGPDRHLDGLWVSPGLHVLRSEVVAAAGRASDHLPICVDLIV
jgi:endonuclease/exonuclease/phosphatase family metal-dependent hydrolase